MNEVWSDACVEPANLTQNISVLRKVLAQHDSTGELIETVPRRGYRFIAPVKEVQMESRALAVIRSLSLAGRGDDAVSRRAEFSSIAILPFINSTALTDGEYFADGLTESIINQLSRIPQLRVVARASVFRYKGQTVDPQRVGRELNVSAVLTGRLERSSDRLIIKAELVDAADGWQLWGEQYQRKLRPF
jgi:TolB-like protein